MIIRLTGPEAIPAAIKRGGSRLKAYWLLRAVVYSGAKELFARYQGAVSKFESISYCIHKGAP